MRILKVYIKKLSMISRFTTWLTSLSSRWRVRTGSVGVTLWGSSKCWHPTRNAVPLTLKTCPSSWGLQIAFNSKVSLHGRSESTRIATHVSGFLRSPESFQLKGQFTWLYRKYPYSNLRSPDSFQLKGQFTWSYRKYPYNNICVRFPEVPR